MQYLEYILRVEQNQHNLYVFFFLKDPPPPNIYPLPPPPPLPLKKKNRPAPHRPAPRRFPPKRRGGTFHPKRENHPARSARGVANKFVCCLFLPRRCDDLGQL